MATEAAARVFFSTPQFAVVGASSDPTKFGHKIFNWYTHHSLPVTPINPRASTITAPYPPSSSGSSSTAPPHDLQTYATLPTLSALPHPTSTAVSIITPPAVTLKVLHEAKAVGVPAVWLQPGSFDDDVLRYALEEWAGAALGGFGGGTRGAEGWCLLVDGEKALRAVKGERAVLKQKTGDGEGKGEGKL